MRTIKVNLFPFAELGEKAQAKALDEFRDREFPWYDDAKATMNGFAELFPAKITSWELGYGRGTHISHEITDGDLEALKGVRLYKWIANNIEAKYYNQGAQDGDCPITGMCYDCDILDPLVDFMKKPDEKDLDELLKDCFTGLHDIVSKDVLHEGTDEATKEFIEANEYEFTEDGKLN